jgi:hypothetical protein
MLERSQILACFAELNEELRKQGHKGEIGIVGGAVMCLVYNTRKATRDVDAVFEPSQIIRNASRAIAQKNRLPEDWLNDGAKGFLVQKFKREEVSRFSNLLIWAPEAKYMLAMKCISARWDTSDGDDVAFLIKHLQCVTPQEVFDIIQDYYPKAQIPAKTQFFIEELCEKAE